MSCEVICCDIRQITDILASGRDGELMKLLFQVLKTQGRLDTRLAGYFEKVLSLLFIRKPKELISMMNEHSLEYLDGVVSHLSSYSITEMLKRTLQPNHPDYMNDGMDFGMGMGGMFLDNGMGLSFGDQPDSGGDSSTGDIPTLSWLTDPIVVDKLVNSLRPETPDGQKIESDVHLHVSDLLADILHNGIRSQHEGEERTEGATDLADFLERQETVDQLMDIGIPRDQMEVCKSSLTAGLSVLGALLTRHANATYSPSQEEEMIPTPVSSLLTRLPQIFRTLKGEETEAEVIRTQYHEERPRLGMQRLKVVGLVVLLVQSRYHMVDQKLVEHGLVPLCLELMFQFELVNMLHADVECMITTILESGSEALQQNLLVEGRLFEKLLHAYEENEEAKKAPKGYVRGYMGHVNRILNTIAAVWDDCSDKTQPLEKMTSSDRLLEMFEESPMWSEMKEFLTNILPHINERETCTLGGMAPPSNSMDDQSSFDYSGFGGQQSVLTSQFADMLESGIAEEDGDLQPSGLGAGLQGEPPILPRLDDSSSSDEDDFVEFDPDGNEVPPPPVDLKTDEKLDEPSMSMEAADEAMASAFQDPPSENWANFDEATKEEESTQDFADFSEFNEQETDES